ncbi:MAG: hypothetical protein DSY92_01235 [Planctomycetota bacterium]|nr:MAG: hypothetical protein DSY92_01235 [Planctomycetota bacterium]
MRGQPVLDKRRRSVMRSIRDSGRICRRSRPSVPESLLRLGLLICAISGAGLLLPPSVAGQQPADATDALETSIAPTLETPQDPASDATPPHPDEQLRQDVVRYLDSAESADWVRALTLLGARLDSGEPPSWSAPLILDLLTDRSGEQPERTRVILQDRLMRSSAIGIPILLVLLRQDATWPFLDEVESNFRSLSADAEVLERLLTDLSARRDPLLISRLLPILAVRDPRGTIDVVIGRLESEQDPSHEALMAALAGFLEMDLDRSGWVHWWQENRNQAIFKGILDRKQAMAMALQLRTWERANRLLREIAPARYRAWLLDSLRDPEPFGIRNAALAEGGRFALEIQAEGVGFTIEEQQELLAPLRDRCLEMVGALDDPETLVTRSQRMELAVGAITALSQMDPFSDDPEVTNLLKQRISTLEPGLSNGARRIARESLKMAIALRSPVSEAVNDAIERFLPVRGEQADIGELKRLITASRAVGATVRTVELLESIAGSVPELQEAVLEALVFGEIPPDGVPLVLAYYGDLLEGSTDANIRALAINGIGRLGVEEAIPLLMTLVLGTDGGSEMERRASLTMIRSIGGVRALDGFIEILTQLPRSDGLYESCIAEALALIPTDPSLGFMRKLLLDESAQHRPWFGELIVSEAVVVLIEAKSQPTDLRTRSPGRFEQWLGLQKVRFQVWISRLLADDAAEVEQGWVLLLDEVNATISLFGEDPLPELLDVVGRQIRGVAAEISGRQAVEAALIAPDPEQITVAFSGYLEDIERFSAGPPPAARLFTPDPWDWLLQHLESRPPLESDPVLVRSMRTLAEGLSARNDVRERLDRLEARADSGDKDRSPSPPLPAPPEEADGRE